MSFFSCSIWLWISILCCRILFKQLTYWPFTWINNTLLFNNWRINFIVYYLFFCGFSIIKLNISHIKVANLIIKTNILQQQIKSPPAYVWVLFYTVSWWRFCHTVTILVVFTNFEIFVIILFFWMVFFIIQSNIITNFIVVTFSKFLIFFRFFLRFLFRFLLIN